MKETVTLAALHEAVLGHLCDRTDSMVFGAQAVNAYVDESRMTEDVDVMSLHAEELAEELRQVLADRFHIAMRVREVIAGPVFRVYQVRTPKNRHVVDLRQVAELPPRRVLARIQVPTPEELISEKVISWVARRRQPKGGSDWRDLAMLLLRFPELQMYQGPVLERLTAAMASEQAVDGWREICSTAIEAPEVEDET